MWLKILIVVLFVAVVISLSSGLIFLMKDVGKPSKRALYALGVRITLATLLLIAVWYGFYSGILSNTAPWAGRY